ncbi:sulfur oxidation c-type cytochrome SoxX [Marimonas arenosa]|uniref:Sulfur oxidation c-type cytochrome SoxX n=1 Tax=Marimonas arenosa TaxID=1795305 RepID=A0AAE3WEW2_9RHOB|nr:sulfur oxidation c-type cytochrome SoxX [Marimonas arenosa]MDQ2091419.1 sulfur oxidation c-type cytochrome SoxX [Marimonas arenosa]
MRFTTLTLAAALCAGAATASEVAPGDVVFNGSAVEASLTGVAGNADEGMKVYSSKKMGNCIACHQISSVDAPFPGNVGPSLDGVGDRWNVAELRGILVNSKMTFEGTVMPAYYRVDGFIRPGNRYTGKAADDTFGPLLEAQQIEDLVAFLSTLKE